MIQDNIHSLQAKITAICQRLKRDPQGITLVAVTKFASVEDIQHALRAGLSHVGENKVQEGQKKFPLLAEAGFKVTRHLIGHLQTNKAKAAVQHFDLIHSVDSLRLAEAIEKEARKLNQNADVLVQINTAGEEQKFGTTPAEALKLIEDIGRLEHLNIKGLMTMAPLTEDQNVVRQTFRDLKSISVSAAAQFAGHPRIVMQYLSMGMTQDYEIALEEGSNMLRIGSAIFRASGQ